MLASVLSSHFWYGHSLSAQGTAPQSAAVDDSNARPPVTKADLQIVNRAREILDSPSKWNRADNRECPAGAKTFSSTARYKWPQTR